MLGIAELAETEGSQVSQMVNHKSGRKRQGLGSWQIHSFPADPQLPAAASGKARLLHGSVTSKLPLLSPPVAGLQTSFSGGGLLSVYQREPGTAHCELFFLTYFLMV